MGVGSLVTLGRKDSKMAWLVELVRRASPASDAAVPPPRLSGPARLLTRMRRILGMAEILCPIPGIPRPRYTNTR